MICLLLWRKCFDLGFLAVCVSFLNAGKGKKGYSGDMCVNVVWLVKCFFG